jgi:hypothetical protein
MLGERVEGLGRPRRVVEDIHVTDPINCDAAKWEGMLDGGVGDAHSTEDGKDNITLQEGRGVTLFTRPKRVRGTNALRG